MLPIRFKRSMLSEMMLRISSISSSDSLALALSYAAEYCSKDITLSADQGVGNRSMLNA
jgi:hypothetical protein